MDHHHYVYQPPATTTGSSTSTQTEFFVVQRCWFDGPKMDPPVDYLRLLTRSQAEHVALESAHAYARSHQAVVRTIVLQANNCNSHGNNTGSMYAYCTAHVLFWVRRVLATVEVGVGNGSSRWKSIIHAVLTNGVIGGSGAGRRGTEVELGRIFCGPSGAQWALQTAQSLMQNNGGHYNNNSYVTCLSIGLPTNNNNGGDGDMLLSAWPDHPLFRETTMATPEDADDDMMGDTSESSKRSLHLVSDSEWMMHSSDTMSSNGNIRHNSNSINFNLQDRMTVDCNGGVLARPAKRQCWVQPQGAAVSMMMPSSSSSSSNENTNNNNVVMMS